jgi:uncharacterized protein
LFLSPLTAQRLDFLHREADLHQVLEHDGNVLAFVLALREGSQYDSLNYRWFLQRYEHFLYVDRVVVCASAHGRGLGRLLYASVFAHARATQVHRVAYEYDIEPPNPASEPFHLAFGFLEVGCQEVAGCTKLVSLQVAELGGA